MFTFLTAFQRSVFLCELLSMLSLLLLQAIWIPQWHIGLFVANDNGGEWFPPVSVELHVNKLTSQCSRYTRRSLIMISSALSTIKPFTRHSNTQMNMSEHHFMYMSL